MGEREVQVEARLTAPLERVWAAWTDPEHVARWLVDEARGQPGRDPVLTWVWREYGMEATYEVLDIEPQARLVLRSTAGERPHTTTLTMEHGEEGTVVRITQSGFPEGPDGDDEAEAGRSGWVLALAVLARYVEEFWGQDRETLLLMRSTRLGTADLRHLLRTQSGLSRWLTRAGSIGEPGAVVQLRLRGGAEITGRVLARTRDEAAVWWDAVRGVLELRSFSGNAGRMAALRVTCWGDPPAPLEREREILDAALDRLEAIRPA